MIISCPSCATKFRINPELIGDGKNMTCAKCQHKWFFSLKPPEHEPEPVSVSAPTPESEPAPSDTPSPAEIEQAIEKIIADNPDDARGPGAAVQAIHEATTARHMRIRPAEHHSTKRAWALLILLIIAVAGLGLSARNGVVAAWPPAARIFDLVGFPVPVLGAGLEIRDLKWEVIREQTIDDNTGETIHLTPTKMKLTGNVVTHLDYDMPIPHMVAKLMDPRNKVISTHSFRADSEKIFPKETIPFTVELPLVQDTDFKILVTFTDKTADHAAPIMAAPTPEQTEPAASHSEPAPAPAHPDQGETAAEPVEQAPAAEHAPAHSEH